MPNAPNYELAENDYMSGMKYKDIARKYGVTLNTVKSWKKRYNWDRKGVHINQTIKSLLLMRWKLYCKIQN